MTLLQVRCAAHSFFSLAHLPRLAGSPSTLVGFIDGPARAFLRYTDKWYAPWVTVALYLLVVQLLLLLQPYLPKRKYTWLTFVHNALVAVESGWILYMFCNQVNVYVSKHGYFNLYCDPNHILAVESDFRFYQSLFYLNKYHELFDTIILILRGNRPSFLALFHHTIMLFVTYYNRWPHLCPVGWLSTVLNLVVHVFMYGYFALHALGITLSFLRIWITRAQIIQFWAILIHALPWPYYRYYYGCLGHWSSWLWVTLPVTFINLLFVQFYLRQYSLQPLSNKAGAAKRTKKD